VQLASLEHPVASVRLGWGDLFCHLEGERQSPVEGLDDPGGHLWGGMPVAGADAAATLQFPMATAVACGGRPGRQPPTDAA
jgi:hypothetical protein